MWIRFILLWLNALTSQSNSYKACIGKEWPRPNPLCMNKLFWQFSIFVRLKKFNSECDVIKINRKFCFRLSVKGAVISISIYWNCDLDQDFMSYCLPKYVFRVLDETGWNFREAKYHEENRRTLFKLYGIKVVHLIH